ncbi:response regulator transcription factor [Nonomuraea soli]|uniref:Two-component system response regulator DesR n=1 Tax=Nonomuraea soli TaxID=1032476 RepID=A0A7W0CSG7_9ACTN|nr:response regulator transcription factor [Nonomuraea soli]MBA2896360.1 two-component system response regulator DesR [Nonomuraea soli]
MSLKVLLAEDMRLLREALTELLGRDPGLRVVAAVTSGDEILPAAKLHAPDVAVIDIHLPVLDGIDAAARLRDELPAVRVLILTALARPAELRRALEAGVAGFLPKDVRPAELAEAVRTVAAGGRAFDQGLTLRALESATSPLTSREAEVLGLAATGLPPAQIAERLHLTYGTVRNYLTSAVDKLGARNRIDAVRIATESGWL